jgi:excisionase family DNA binding protein
MRAGTSTRLLSIDQAAEALGVTPGMIRRLTANRQLPFVKVGDWFASGRTTSSAA